MASIRVRESSFCDKAHNDTLSQIMYNQKQSAIFCDVVMKVCDREIFAHSNILAAASPYFGTFLGQDLPRQFSQRAPQVIEIQIDGNEPNVLYEEAVGAVIDYIYTGKMLVKETNVFQISEIARIMQIDTIVQFCDDFSIGKVGASELWEVLRSKTFPTKTRSDAAVNTDRIERYSDVGLSRQRARKLVSVSTQVVPQLLGMKPDSIQTVDKSTSTSGNVTAPPAKPKPHHSKRNSIRHGDPTKQKISADCGADGIHDVTTSPEKTNSQHTYTVILQPSGDGVISSLTDGETFQLVESLNSSENADIDQSTCCDETTKECSIPQCSDFDKETVHSSSGTRPTTDRDTSEKEDTEKIDTKPDNSDVAKPDNSDVVIVGMRRSRRTPKPSLKMAMTAPKRKGSLSQGTGTPGTNEQDSEKENTVAGRATKAERIKMESPQEEVTVVHLESSEESIACTTPDEHDATLPTEEDTSFLPGKYQCDSCDFTTNRVREMTNHKKLHKLALNTCYYCDERFDCRDVLNDHISRHKGPMPFFCPTCDTRFRTRTQLNLHLPKHSKEKPFICEVCSMGFKWKHALKNHMITHSNKKDHLCDVCGYATAHKSQLKAHRLVHSGDTFHCPHADCAFQATKRQNLKYHMLTHTREKPHQCEVCGQSFSLVKNMRRHMMLHQLEKPHRCDECDFSTTRYDKLKEHMLKQHGLGSPPEKRVRITDQVMQYTIEPSKHINDIKFDVAGADDDGGMILGNDSQSVQLVPNQTIIIAQPPGMTAEAALQMAQLGDMTVILADPDGGVMGDEAEVQTLNAVQTISDTQYQTVQYAEVMIPVVNDVACLVQQVAGGYVAQ